MARHWLGKGIPSCCGSGVTRSDGAEIMFMQKSKWFVLGVVLIGLNLTSIQLVRAEEEAVDYRPFTLSLDAGTLGPGVSASWRFWDHLGVQAGVNGFFGASVGVGDRDIEGITYDTEVKLMSEQLALDFYPWKESTFRITLGVLLNQNELEGEMPQSSVAGTFVTVGSGVYQTSDFSLHMAAEQQPVCPYLSIGASFYLDEANRWSLGGELGVAFTGSPEVTLVQGGGAVLNPADIEQERQQIEDSAWKIYPIVKLSLSFSF